jgi:hypothetical protein
MVGAPQANDHRNDSYDICKMTFPLIRRTPLIREGVSYRGKRPDAPARECR